MNRTNPSFKTRRKVITRVLCVLIALALLPGLSVFADLGPMTIVRSSDSGASQLQKDTRGIDGETPDTDTPDTPDTGADSSDEDDSGKDEENNKPKDEKPDDSEEENDSSEEEDEDSEEGDDSSEDDDKDSEERDDSSEDDKDSEEGDDFSEDDKDSEEGDDSSEDDKDSEEGDDSSEDDDKDSEEGDDSSEDDDKENEEDNAELEDEEKEDDEDDEPSLTTASAPLPYDSMQLFQDHVSLDFEVNSKTALSGALVTFKTLVGQTDSGVDNWGVYAGDLQVRYTLPKGTRLHEGPTQQSLILVENGGEFSPDDTPDPDDEFQYLWITMDYDFKLLGETFTFTAYPTPTGYTPDGKLSDTVHPITATLFYQGQEGGNGKMQQEVTQEYSPTVNVFGWRTPNISIGGKTTEHTQDLTAVDASGPIPIGTANLVFEYSNIAPNVTKPADTYGSMYTKDVTIRDVYTVETDETSGLPYLLIPGKVGDPLPSLFTFDTYSAVKERTSRVLEVKGDYVTKFEVVWTFENGTADNEVPSEITYASTLKFNLSKDTQVSTEAIQRAMESSDGTFTFQIVNLQLEDDEVFGTANALYEVDAENPSTFSPKELPYKFKITMDKETLGASDTIKKTVTAVDGSGNSAAEPVVWPGQTVTYRIGDFANKQWGQLDNYVITDTFNNKAMIPVSMTTGQYTWTDSAETVEIKVSLVNSSNGNRVDLAGTYAAGQSTPITFAEHVTNPDELREYDQIVLDFGALPKGFTGSGNNYPTLTFRVDSINEPGHPLYSEYEQTLKDKKGMRIDNHVELAFTYKGDPGGAKDSATVIFMSDNIVLDEHTSKTVTNVTSSSRKTAPLPGDVLQYTITVRNSESLPFIADLDLFDYYDGTKLRFVDGKDYHVEGQQVSGSLLPTVNSGSTKLSPALKVNDWDPNATVHFDTGATWPTMTPYTGDKSLLHIELGVREADGTGDFTKVWPGTEITITYYMQVREDVAYGTDIVNKFRLTGWYWTNGGTGGTGNREFVEFDGENKITTGQAQKPTYSIVKSATRLGEGSKDTSRLVDGDEVQFTITVTNTQLSQYSEDLPIYSIIDFLPYQFFGGEAKWDRSLIRDVSATHNSAEFGAKEYGESDLKVILYTGGDDVFQTHTSRRVGFVFNDNYDPIVLKPGGKDYITVRFTVTVEAAQYLIDQQLATSGTFYNYGAAMTSVHQNNLTSSGSGKGKHAADGKNFDDILSTRSGETITYLYNDKQVTGTVYRTDSLALGIDKKVTSKEPMTFTDVASANQTRSYEVTITNHNANSGVRISKLVDRLPLFESYSGGFSGVDCAVTQGTFGEGNTFTVTFGGGGLSIPANGSYTLKYTTEVKARTDSDGEGVIDYLRALEDKEKWEGVNSISMYVVGDDGNIELLSGTMVDNDDSSSPADNWDGDTSTKYRYMAQADVANVYLPVIPAIHMNSMSSTRSASGVYTFKDYKEEAIQPGSRIAWKMQAYNYGHKSYSGTSTTIDKPILVLVMDGGLSDFKVNEGDSNAIKGKANLGNLIEQYTTADGRTVLVYQTNMTLTGKGYSNGTSNTMIVEAKTEDGEYSQYNASAFLLPAEYFYDSMVRNTDQRTEPGYLNYPDFAPGFLLDYISNAAEGYDHAVRADANIKVFGDMATSARITVTELDPDSGNRINNSVNSDASSIRAQRVIELTGDKYTPFSYDLEIMNMGTVDYSQIAIINRLPNKGDRTEVAGVARYSDAGARLRALDTSFVATLYNADSKQTTVLDPSRYTVEYSGVGGNVHYTQADWKGETGAGQWQPVGSFSSANDVTAFRIVFDKNLIMTPNDTLTVTYDAQFLLSDIVTDGQTAYNTFGYSYSASLLGRDFDLQTDPASVGVMLKILQGDRITISKTLTNAATTHPEIDFSFMVQQYNGETYVKDYGPFEITLTSNGSQDNTVWSSEITSILQELPLGYTYRLIEVNNPAFEFIYETTGLDTPTVTPIGENGEGNLHHFDVTNELIPYQSSVTINKLVNLLEGELLEDLVFPFRIVGTDKDGNVQYEETVEIEVKKIGAGYSGSITKVYNSPLELIYTVEELTSELTGSYDVVLWEENGNGDNGTWVFSFINTPTKPDDPDPEAYVEIEKILEEDTASPTRTSFEFELQHYDGLTLAKTTNHTVTLTRDDNGKWSGTTGAIQVDPSHSSFKVVELGSGYHVQYKPVDIVKSVQDDVQITKWYFSVTNTPEQPDEAYVEIQKVLLENTDTPSRTTFEIQLNGYDAGGKLVATTPYELTLTRAANGYWTGSTGQITVDPTLTYDCVEITPGYDAFYSIHRTRDQNNGAAITRWTLVVNNRLPVEPGPGPGPGPGPDPGPGPNPDPGPGPDPDPDPSPGPNPDPGPGTDPDPGRPGPVTPGGGGGGGGGGGSDRPDRDPDGGGSGGDDLIKINDDPIPLADAPGLITIMDENVPLGGLPITGGAGGKKRTGLLALLGGALAALFSRKRQEED